MPTGLDGELDRLDVLEPGDLASASHERDELPEGSRQILIVDSHRFVCSNFLDSTASGKTDSRTVLRLSGQPSPSSHPELAHAYITFVDGQGSVPSPAYSRTKGAIFLWLRSSALPAVLAQMSAPRAYCWIGHFAGGHLYADIHTEDSPVGA